MVKQGIARKDVLVIVIIFSVSGLFGARIIHFVFNFRDYFNGELSFFDLHMKNFTVVGGLLGTVIAGVLLSRKYKFNYWKIGDLLIPWVAFGIVFARVGCFLNGCCFGHVTSVPWGVKFPTFSFAHQYQMMQGLTNIFVVLKVHPTQLYELIAVALGGVCAILLNKKKVFDGLGFLFFVSWYSVFRAFNLYFRVLPDSMVLSLNQYILLHFIIFLFCVILIYRINVAHKFSHS